MPPHVRRGGTRGRSNTPRHAAQTRAGLSAGRSAPANKRIRRVRWILQEAHFSDCDSSSDFLIIFFSLTPASPPICQSLLDNASRQLVGAVHIVNAKRRAVAISE